MAVAGLIVQVDSGAGSTQVYVSGVVNPDAGVIVIVALPVPPWATLIVVTLAERENAGITVTDAAVGETELEYVPLPVYAAVMLAVPKFT